VLSGGATATGMIPTKTPEEIRLTLLPAKIIVPPAVYLASDDGRRITGRRLVAKDWTPGSPEGTVAADGIGG